MADKKREPLRKQNEGAKLIVDRVRARLDLIRRMVASHDFEVAHQEQVELYEDVLKVAAAGWCDDQVGIAAKLALKAAKLVDRWE